MREALREAAKGIGRTSPNPAVGAVLVEKGRIAARGFHRGAGHRHAEIDCLEAYGRTVSPSATLYVTLEPCSTAGRTPPCTDALIQSGIRNVVIGAIDPNPKHTGRAIELLRAAGINVRVGVLAKECAGINEAFNKWIRTRLPFVIAKCGMTLDGRLARPMIEERWITSPAARRHSNRFRAEVDAILIGAETLRVDDPRLTAREVKGARQPWRVILTRSGRLPKHAKVLTDRFADRTLVFRNQRLEQVLKALGEKEITSVLIEGGGEVLGQALDARLIDRVRIYLGPLLTCGPVLAFPGLGAAGTGAAVRLHDLCYEQIRDDIFLSAKTAAMDDSPE